MGDVFLSFKKIICRDAIEKIVRKFTNSSHTVMECTDDPDKLIELLVRQENRIFSPQDLFEFIKNTDVWNDKSIQQCFQDYGKYNTNPIQVNHTACNKNDTIYSKLFNEISEIALADTTEFQLACTSVLLGNKDMTNEISTYLGLYPGERETMFINPFNIFVRNNIELDRDFFRKFAAYYETYPTVEKLITGIIEYSKSIYKCRKAKKGNNGKEKISDEKEVIIYGKIDSRKFTGLFERLITNKNRIALFFQYEIKSSGQLADMAQNQYNLNLVSHLESHGYLFDISEFMMELKNSEFADLKNLWKELKQKIEYEKQ